MKRLFLASVAANTLDLIIPLLPDSPSKLKLAFVPTASNIYKNREWVDIDRNKLIDMGFSVKDVDIEGKSESVLREELSGIDVLFVSGGNTFYLLEKARESGFDKLAKEFIDAGKVYIGSSAGSVFVCSTIEFVSGMDDPKVAPNLKSYEGLNEVDFLLMPHQGDDEYKELYDKVLTKWRGLGYEVKTLTNNEALIVKGDKSEIVRT